MTEEGVFQYAIRHNRTRDHGDKAMPGFNRLPNEFTPACLGLSDLIEGDDSVGVIGHSRSNFHVSLVQPKRSTLTALVPDDELGGRVFAALHGLDYGLMIAVPA